MINFPLILLAGAVNDADRAVSGAADTPLHVGKLKIRFSKVTGDANPARPNEHAELRPFLHQTYERDDRNGSKADIGDQCLRSADVLLTSFIFEARCSLRDS